MSEQTPTWWAKVVSLVITSLPEDTRETLLEDLGRSMPTTQKYKLAVRIALELPPEQLEKLIDLAVDVADPATLEGVRKRLDSGDKKGALIGLITAVIGFVLRAWLDLFAQAPLEDLPDKTWKFIKNLASESWETLRETVTEEQGEAPHPLTPEMIHIPAGKFWMGTNRMAMKLAGKWRSWMEDETPYRQIYLPGYAIGKYPVTNSEFARFIEDGGYKKRKYWTEAGWEWWEKREDRIQPRCWDQDRWNKPSYPVVGVSWYEAVAYCNWLAARTGQPYRLPSEAEWEKAARGTDGRIYPWGDEKPTSDLCNFGKNESGTTLVGKYSPRGDSPYGCVDMAGNVWEWTRSLYRDYPYDPGDGRESLDAGNHVPRVLRGGAFNFSEDYVRCACRLRSYPNYRYRDLGLRVVVSPFRRAQHGIPLNSEASGL